MPKLCFDEQVVKWTIDHVLAHGDTDIFPYPFEFKFLADRRDAIAARIAELDLYTFHPTSPLESIVPKSRFGFRVAHQLFHFDCIVLTAAVVTIGEEMERARMAAQDNVAFAYRFEPREGGELFSLKCRYHDWLSYLFARTAFDEGISEVIETDIADFFHRIYHHRLENILQNCTGGSQFAALI